MQEFLNGRINIINNDAYNVYETWPAPIVIVSDGPYGVKGYPGDLPTHDGLSEWYEPHVKMWSKFATPQTTLWFWNTELGWANVHPILEKYGWEYKACNVWDKGMGHVAGNINTKTIKRLPVVTEVCVQYVKKAEFYSSGKTISMQSWLRQEWKRTGLPFSKTNAACGVANAASRKYFTKCHLWYMPPSNAFTKIAEYANKYGAEEGKPYFSIDGINVLSEREWEQMKAKFYCPLGVTNVWETPQLSGKERIKSGGKAVHLNQKPLELIERIISMSSDANDIVWDPFGGLFTGSIASMNLERTCYSAEINSDVFHTGIERITTHLDKFE